MSKQSFMNIIKWAILIFGTAIALFFAVKSSQAQTLTYCPLSGDAVTNTCAWSNTQDFSNVTLMKARVGAALTSSVNGDFGFDSTNSNWHFWNGADSIIAPILVSALPSNGQIPQYVVSGGKITETGISTLPSGISLNGHRVGNSVFCSAASGSGTTYTCSTTPSFTPADGDLIDFDADVTNTGAITLNVNGVGAVAVNKWVTGNSSPTALVAGDIQANQPVWVYFDSGLNIWSLMSPVSQIAASQVNSGTINCARQPALTGDTTTSAGSCATTTAKINGTSFPTSATVIGSNGSAQPVAASTTGSGTTVALATSPNLNTPALASPAFSGTATGNSTIPFSILQPAGGITFTNQAAPSNPASGNIIVYGDSGTGNFSCRTSTGTSCISATAATPLTSSTANPAGSGILRAANTDKVCWRNAANSADDCVGEIQHARTGNLCTTSGVANGTCSATLNWPSAFADANYTANCTVNGTASAYVVSISSKSTTSVTPNIQNVGGSSAGIAVGVDCTGIHD